MRIPRIARPALALVLAVASLSTAWHAPAAIAQAPRERTLYVSAVDDRGEPVDGLDVDAFIVREDNQRREVLRVSRATEPIDIAVLVDNSAAADGEITDIRDGVGKFVKQMAGGNRIALITLADRPTSLVEYTGDATRLADGVGRLFAMSQSGMTLLDAIFETARGLEKREGPRAAIVAVVTDGIEFTNRYSRDVVAAVRRAGASLHIVGMGRFSHSEEHSLRERSFLIDEGPRATGGSRELLLASMALPEAMQRLGRELSSQYKVVYGRPDSLYGSDTVDVTSARPGVTMRGTWARGETGARR